MSSESIDKRKLREEIKDALARLRREKAASIEKEVDESIEFSELKKRASAELERIKEHAISTADNELAYEWLAHYSNERLKHENKLISRIEKELGKLREAFLKREISVREFKTKLSSLKRELMESKACSQLFQDLHERSLEKLKKFKRVPSFVSAQHERMPSKWHEMIRERFADLFREEKLERLRALEKELIVAYHITEKEIRKALRRAKKLEKEPLLDLPALEKKAMRELTLIDKLSQGFDFFWERLRALDIVVEIRKYLEQESQKLVQPKVKKPQKAKKSAKGRKKKQKETKTKKPKRKPARKKTKKRKQAKKVKKKKPSKKHTKKQKQKKKAKRKTMFAAKQKKAQTSAQKRKKSKKAKRKLKR
ncbi:MAG: hypothetical protein J7J87_04175 [Candidatus Diapherotrites archaeon]|nr:hypothetical protein [Candidatus Diapherotrites archaeon]